MPYMGYYGIDMYYIVLVLPCVLFAFWAQSQVNGTFNRYSRRRLRPCCVRTA